MSRRYHHGDLRNALLDAAVAVAAEEGVSAVTVSRLARACGVSSGAPFRHFPSRTHLLVAAAERAADRQLEAITAAASGVEDPVERQRVMAVAYVRWALEHPGDFAILDAREALDGSDRLKAANDAFQQQMDAVLGQSQEGAVSPELVRRTAGTLAAQALIYGLARMLVDGALGERTAEEAERLAWEVTGVLGEGLGG